MVRHSPPYAAALLVLVLVTACRAGSRRGTPAEAGSSDASLAEEPRESFLADAGVSDAGESGPLSAPADAEADGSREASADAATEAFVLHLQYAGSWSAGSGRDYYLDSSGRLHGDARATLSADDVAELRALADAAFAGIERDDFSDHPMDVDAVSMRYVRPGRKTLGASCLGGGYRRSFDPLIAKIRRLAGLPRRRAGEE